MTPPWQVAGARIEPPVDRADAVAMLSTMHANPPGAARAPRDS
jgi:hypothetical protein